MREGIQARWYIDGRDYYADLADAMEAAKKTIFITDWFITPEIYMKRDYPASAANRLDRLLQRKARQGVRIFILSTILLLLRSSDCNWHCSLAEHYSCDKAQQCGCEKEVRGPSSEYSVILHLLSAFFSP